MTLALQLLWLALPIIAAGLVHLAVMKLDLLPGLRRLPIDGGLTFRGRRLFGDNKTWRGAVVTITTTTLTAWGLAHLSGCCWSLPTLAPFAETHPVVWGLLLITGGGGWPLNCFALPDGRPFFGGTYFRKEQWVQLLENIHLLFQTRKEDLIKQAKASGAK